MAVRPVPSIPRVTSSAVELAEYPDGPFLLNNHILSLSLSLSLSQEPKQRSISSSDDQKQRKRDGPCIYMCSA